MNAKEAELVTEEFCSREDTYNVCPGGKGGWGYVNAKGLNFGSNAKAANSRGGRTCIERYGPPKSPGTGVLNDAFVAGRQKLPFLGRKHTDKSRKQMKESHKGKHTGEKNGSFGTHWITDGTVSQKIKTDDVLPNGWRYGRTCK